MEWMVWPGAGVAVLGLAGLAYCILTARKLRDTGLEGEPSVGQLQRLIPINLASVFVATIGLAMIVIGINR